MNRITSPRLNRNDDPELQEQPTVAELQQRFHEQAEQLMTLALDPREDGQRQETTFKTFELALIPMDFALGRTLIMQFPAAAHERVARRTPASMRRHGRRFRKVEPKGRCLECWFCLVRYWRTYMAEKADKDRRGFHPLDLDLGLTKDCLSTVVLIRLIDLAASPILKVRVLTEARKVKALRSSVELWDSDTSKVPRRTNVKHYQTIVDMNGDGRADVVLQDKQAVRVCLNQGSQYGPSVQRVARRNADAQDHAAAAHSPGHPERERR